MANDVLDHVFDILGSGRREFGCPIAWHEDVTSGARWPLDLFWTIDYTNIDRASDVKIPWEIARFHLGLWLGQAYGATGDERYALGYREIVDSWIDANPVGQGIHWACPMELAIRAVNWMHATVFFESSKNLDEPWWAQVFAALWWHGEIIEHNLEYGRLLGNHYIKNGLGLFALGILFRGSRDGRRWLRRGVHILRQQIRWQVHPDGVSYEKSISYHRLVLESFAWALVVGERAGVTFGARYTGRLRRMFEFMDAYTRDDGSTPWVSDADDGRLLRWNPALSPTDHRETLHLGVALFPDSVTPRTGGAGAAVCWLLGPEAVAKWQRRPRRQPGRSKAFPAGGYYVIQDEHAHMFIDAGTIGFGGDSVHGHNDILSFELVVEGEVFIVDSGTYGYTRDPAAYRALASTRAHNTIMVDGQEVAEFVRMWHIKADLTSPRLLTWSVHDDTTMWQAEHRAYTRLSDPVIHRRTMIYQAPERQWTIRDQLLGREFHVAEGHLYLHPTVAVTQVGPNEVLASRSRGSLRVQCSAPIDIIDGWVAPSYGVRKRTQVLRFVHRGQAPITIETALRWEPR